MAFKMRKPKRMKDAVISAPKSTHLKQDVVRSSPKTTHLKSGKVKSLPKTTHPGKNLGKYLHKSKLPTGAKIGVTVKKPRKSNNLMKGY